MNDQHVPTEPITLEQIMPSPVAGVIQVTLLPPRFNDEVRGTYEHRHMVCPLSITYVKPGGASVSSIEQILAQASFDSTLNPTDIQYRVRVNPTAEDVVSQFEETETGILNFTRHCIGYRSTPRVEGVYQSSVPWKQEQLSNPDRIYHLSFLGRMEDGYIPWLLYKLDIRNPENPTFDFVKSYLSVQGQIRD